jgi:putative aminopeptidase FrvX
MNILDEELVFDVLSVPSVTGHEVRMREYLVDYAGNDDTIDVTTDKNGNVYFTKGKLDDGEYYPCLTAHMDTVQTWQLPYVIKNTRLDVLKTSLGPDITIAHCDGNGIGADDKCGIAIILCLFKRLEKAKACFFVEEETGCYGSAEADMKWLSDVGYCISFDSPMFNRACWKSGGVKLFDGAFYKERLDEICTRHGMVNFREEAYTDIKNLRRKTGTACVVLGTGYINQHTNTEVCVLEDMEKSAALGLELIESLGTRRYPIAEGTLDEEMEDNKFLKTLAGRK